MTQLVSTIVSVTQNLEVQDQKRMPFCFCLQLPHNNEHQYINILL